MTLEERKTAFDREFQILIAKYGLVFQANAFIVIDGVLVIRNKEEIAGKTIEPRVELYTVPVQGWVDPTQAPEQDKKVVDEVVAHKNGRKPKLVKQA